MNIVLRICGWSGWRRSLVAIGLLAGAMLAAEPVTFVFTSDVHYGINRGSFRGAGNVESRIVNAALVEKINRLPAAVLPADGGFRAGQAVGPVAFVIVTGDIASRMIYADWLEGRGDVDRADIVRRLAEGGALDAQLLLALAPTNVRWRARVLEPAIEQCAREDCNRHWGALERTARADLRRCGRCTKLALYCVNAGQAAEHRSNGGVVVYDPFASRTRL